MEKITPNHAGVKAQRYGWTRDLGKLPGYREIPIHELGWDPDYQRTRLSEKTVALIVREFNWSRFGVLTVVSRDGALLIVDGRHRWQAAIRRGGIKTVPCVVVDSQGPEHEAQTFVGMNRNRTPVSSIDRYRAMVAARDPEYIDCEEMLHRHGLKVNNNSENPSFINFSEQLIRSFQLNRSECNRALAIQRSMIGSDESLNGAIHKGIFWILTAKPGEIEGDLAQFAHAIFKKGGKSEVLNAIRAAASLRRNEGCSPQTCAMGIIDIANRSIRGKKIHVSIGMGR